MSEEIMWECELCKKEFKTRTECVNHEKNCKLKMVIKSDKIKEFKRTCKECKKVWHSLESREKQVQKDISINNLSVLGNCCCNPGAQLQAKRNVEANQDALSKLKQCPNCGSVNYKEEILYHDKK